MGKVRPLLADNGKEATIKTFPNPLAPASVKADERYGMAYARAIWNAYDSKDQNVNDRRQRDIINRRYAEGLESVDKYKNRLDVQDTSYLNLDYSPTNRIASIVDNIVGRMMNMNYKIQCTPIDRQSLVKQDAYRRKMYANMFLKDVSPAFEQMTGVPLVPKDSRIPEDQDEAELHMQLNYKADLSASMEQALQYVFYNNQFEDSKKKLLRDLVVLKKGALIRYYDENKDIKIEWQDPVDIITPYSKWDDFRNIPYQAVIGKYTIQQISQMTSEFSEAELFDIARNCSGANLGNPSWNASWGNSYEGYYQSNSRVFGRDYDDFNVNVLRFWFKATNKDRYEERINTKRNLPFDFKKRDDEYVPPSDKKDKRVKSNMIEKKTDYIYEGHWIIGTDYIFGYKMQENIDREKEGISYSPHCELPIIMIYPDIYDMQNKSLVERMIPHEDQINLIHYKTQQFLMEAAPPGLAIDISGLDEIVAGMGRGENVEFDPKSIVKFKKQTGHLLFSSQRADGSVINGKPVETLENGIGRTFSQFIVAYNHEVQLMNDVIGYNSAVDASSPDKEALVGTQKLAVQASMNVLRPLGNTFIRIVEKSSQRLSLMIQDKCEFGGGIKGYIPAIGEIAAQTIEIGKDISLAQFGIKVEMLPDDEEKAELMRLIEIGLQNGSLKPSDVIMIREYMKTSVKLAAQLMVLREKRNIKERQAEAMSNAQANAAQQVQSAQAAEVAKRETIQMEMAINDERLKKEAYYKSELSRQEHQQKLVEIDRQSQGKVVVQEVANEGKVEVAKETNDGKLIQESFKNSITPQKESKAA